MNQPATDVSFDKAVPGSFIAAIGLRLLMDGDVTRGHAEIGPWVWAKGSDRLRLGALATMVDVVGGMRPSGSVTPTIDLNVQSLAELPSTGSIDLVCHPMKEGRRLFVGEVLVHHGETLVARGVVTFLNQPYTGPGPSAPRNPADDIGVAGVVRFDDWLSPEYVDERTVLVERTPFIANPSGTIQGGAQATAAELAAEWVLVSRGRYVTVDLDIRYLNPLTAGPLAATADVLGVHDDRAFVRVLLSDAGADDRPIAHVTTVCRRLP